MFGLFKNKNQEIVKTIYEVFEDKIHFYKKSGKLEYNNSFGEIFTSDDYLLGFFNTYISIVIDKSGYLKDRGIILATIYALLDEIYADDRKLEIVFEKFLSAKSNGSNDFILGKHDASMFYAVLANDIESYKFSQNPIYKEAIKFFETGEFKVKKILPKNFSTGRTFSDIPSNIIIAYRIFEKTFEKRLNIIFN